MYAIRSYYVDSTSASRMIAWAMELYEQGKITQKDTDGIALNWGNTEAIVITSYSIHYTKLYDFLWNDSAWSGRV